MKILLKSAMIAGLMLGSATAPAFAQNTSPVVAGLAVADLDGAMATSKAFSDAQQQRRSYYKAQIDQAQARGTAIQAQLQPMADKLKRDATAAGQNPTPAQQQALQQQYEQIQRLQESGQQEVNRILQPVALSEAYVREQIEDKLDQAVKNAMGAKKVSLLLSPQAILAVTNQAYNLTTDITNQLNTLLPAAQLVPPAGWLPRQIREQQAAQAQQQQGQGAAPAQPAGPQPQGR
jgi:Skp family chaperone for outer membrane proteins